jgi:hypothetical protein
MIPDETSHGPSRLFQRRIGRHSGFDEIQACLSGDARKMQIIAVHVRGNHHWLTTKLRIQHLLYRDKEGIEVNTPREDS